MNDDARAYDRATTRRGEMARWARQRGGRPVEDTAAGDDEPSLAVAFPGSDDHDGAPVDWDEFVDRLDEAGLAFAYETDPDVAADAWGLVDRERLPLEPGEGAVEDDAPTEAADDREIGGLHSEPRAREAADESNLDAHRDEPPFDS